MEIISIFRTRTALNVRQIINLSSRCAQSQTRRSVSLTAAARRSSGFAQSEQKVSGEPLSTTDVGANRTGKTKVLYDGECPLCVQEIKFLSYLNRKKDAIQLVDISEPGYDQTQHNNIPLDEAMGIMHVIGPDNTVHKRVDALHAMYAAVGHSWLTAYMKWPVLSGMFDRGYMWFARNRLWLTRRQCEEGNCKVPDR